MANTYTATVPFGAITVHRVVSAFSTLVAKIATWNETRRTVNALRVLTPAQLDDIGLTPADVEDFAHGRL